MPLPAFNNTGDLPPGLHVAPWAEIEARFGSSTPQRRILTASLRRMCDLARATGNLERLVLFGSYVTEEPSPHDIDVVLVMSDTFDVAACKGEAQRLFDHHQAEREFGASVFWIRPSLLLLETLDEFLEHWQVKRDGGRRGIVEVSS
jgi:predicted nucleotidyltransferase